MNQVADRLSFEFATQEDDAALRRLLRDNPMRGSIAVAFTHEPDYFRSTSVAGAMDRTLVAREDDRVVAAGRCITADRWIDGEMKRVAYLGELRLDASVQGRADIILKGYRFFAEEYSRDPADFCFTSIVADNARARRMLERGIRSMPRYEPIADFTTIVTRARKSRPVALPAGSSIVCGEDIDPEELVGCLNRFGVSRNLSMRWTAARIKSLVAHSLHVRDFVVLKRGASVAGCVAVWDQRPFRQVVVHGYGDSLRIARPFVNFAGVMLRWPRLPPPGSTLAQAFLSPFAVDADSATLLPALLREATNSAARRGIEVVSLGISSGDPLERIVRSSLRGRCYECRLYSVTWPGCDGALELDGRPCLPELALL